MIQPSFRQVHILLDPAQDLVADNVFVPQLEERQPFNLEGFA